MVKNLKDVSMGAFTDSMTHFASNVSYWKTVSTFDRADIPEYNEEGLKIVTLHDQIQWFLVTYLRQSKQGKGGTRQRGALKSPGVIRSAYSVFKKFYKVSGRGCLAGLVSC